MTNAPENHVAPEPMALARPAPSVAGQTGALGLAPGSPFRVGECRVVNVGTERKPSWSIEGPVQSRADKLWTAEVSAGVCIARLFRLRNHARDGADARGEIRAWVGYLRNARRIYE